MIQFGNIIIEGFCSIPYLELNLGLRGITVIRGATGEGKTTILSALVWAVYGKNIKGKSDVNTWEKYRQKNLPAASQSCREGAGGMGECEIEVRDQRWLVIAKIERTSS